MIDTDKYEGHTEGEWRWYEGARHKSLTGSMRLLMFAEDGNNEHPKPADAALIEDAPIILEGYKQLYKVIELIGKNMAYDPWMHTLIKEAIGYEKWQAKEMIE